MPHSYEDDDLAEEELEDMKMLRSHLEDKDEGIL